MNIVYHLTDNYARISGTSIVSIFENNKEAKEINVYLIENGFTEKTKQKFINLASKYKRKIFYMETNNHLCNRIYNSNMSINNRSLYNVF